MVVKKYHYHACEDYPFYTFKQIRTAASEHATMMFTVSIVRNVDATLMVDLLIGEILSLVPYVPKDKKNEVHENKWNEPQLYKIMTIDQSPNGRRSVISVIPL
jgi:hypothetical protein